jgi:hypothetical protein
VAADAQSAGRAGVVRGFHGGVPRALDGRQRLGGEAGVAELPLNVGASRPHSHPPLEAVRTQGTPRVLLVGRAVEPPRDGSRDARQKRVALRGAETLAVAVAIRARVLGLLRRRDALELLRGRSQVVQVHVAARGFAARVLDVVRLVQDNKRAGDVHVHRRAHRRVQQVVVRTKHELGGFVRVLRREVRTPARFLSQCHQVLDVNGLSAWF